MCVCVHGCLCEFVCVYVCFFVCLNVSVCFCLCGNVSVCFCDCGYVFVCFCVCLNVSVCLFVFVLVWMCLCVLSGEFEQKLHLKQQCSKRDLSLLQSRYWRGLAQHLHPAAASRLIIEICKMHPRTHNLGTGSSLAIFVFFSGCFKCCPNTVKGEKVTRSILAICGFLWLH